MRQGETVSDSLILPDEVTVTSATVEFLKNGEVVKTLSPTIETGKLTYTLTSEESQALPTGLLQIQVKAVKDNGETIVFDNVAILNRETIV